MDANEQVAKARIALATFPLRHLAKAYVACERAERSAEACQNLDEAMRHIVQARQHVQAVWEARCLRVIPDNIHDSPA